jgi:RNA polymerase sigma-70 factor (ECF subfamily)
MSQPIDPSRGADTNTTTASNEPDDAALIERSRRGDEQAVGQLIARHNQRLFRVARAVVRDDAEAEDVVQETYVRAFTHLDSFRGEARLSTWLTRIALNEALGRLRKRRPGTPLDELDSSDDGNGRQSVMAELSASIENPEAATGRSQMRRMLEDVVDRLPDPFRIVFVLRDIEGMSIVETAEHLAIREETVKTRLHRARKLIRSAIEERTKSGFAELFPFAGVRCAEVANRVIRRLRDPYRMAETDQKPGQRH